VLKWLRILNLIFVFSTGIFTGFIAGFTPEAFAFQQPTALTEKQRSSLRYHLQNLLNEETLVIRNHRADLSDIRRQEKDFAELRVFDRIPFSRDLKGLKGNLTNSAKLHHLKTRNFRVIRYSTETKKPPRTIDTSGPPFHFGTDQLVETIYFQVEVLSSEKTSKKLNPADPPRQSEADWVQSRINDWIKNWSAEQLRITQIDSLADSVFTRARSAPARLNHRFNIQLIRAHAYRFRENRFPELRPSSPLALLPQWAQRNPEILSKDEPLLWHLIQKIQDLRPNTANEYQSRGILLLNNARMDFFLSKVTNS